MDASSPTFAPTSIRARAVLWYLAIFVFIFGTTLVAAYQVLLLKLDREIDQDLRRQIAEVHLVQASHDTIGGQGGSPGGDRPHLFERFIAEEVPSTGQVLFGLADGQLVAARPFQTALMLTATIELDEAGLERSEGPTSGTAIQSGIEYRWLADDFGSHGVFVVAADITTERAEITGALTVVAMVTGIGLAIGIGIAWTTTSRMLAPLLRTTEAARKINASDLSTRLPITSNDEVGQLSATINDMLDRLDTAFKTRQEFIDDLGHELRTPLTILRGHLDVFPTDPAEQEETILLCQDELARMGRDVEGLVVLAKSRQPSFLACRPVEAAEILDQAVQRATELHPDHTIRGIPLARQLVVCDPDRVKQALANLTANACQHAPAGSTVTISLRRDLGALRFEVADEGIGIDPADYPRIFERFGRGNDTTTRREGVGLGLAIVRAVAEAHHGTVGVASRNGKGARLWFTIAVTDFGLNPDADTLDLRATNRPVRQQA